jgi:hypothetical protein
VEAEFAFEAGEVVGEEDIALGGLGFDFAFACDNGGVGVGASFGVRIGVGVLFPETGETWEARETWGDLLCSNHSAIFCVSRRGKWSGWPARRVSLAFVRRSCWSQGGCLLRNFILGRGVLRINLLKE